MRLTMENISVSFGSRTVLDSSTLAIETGRVTALIGRNGTGKSSVFRSLYGIYPNRDIIVTVDGTYIRRPYLRAGLINYLPQQPSHPPQLTVARLLNYYDVERRKFLSDYPLYATCTDHRLDELSRGTERLLLCLIALRADTYFTVLDEPFSNVMPLHNNLLRTAIWEARKRKGILLSDHQYQTVLDVADTLYLIADRRIRLLDDPGELVDLGYLPEGTFPARRRH